MQKLQYANLKKNTALLNLTKITTDSTRLPVVMLLDISVVFFNVTFELFKGYAVFYGNILCIAYILRGSNGNME